MPKTPKPWPCRLGLHRWYCDGAIFYSIERCSRCPTVKNPLVALWLERERKLWAEEKLAGGSFDDQMNRVSARLFGATP